MLFSWWSLGRKVYVVAMSCVHLADCEMLSPFGCRVCLVDILLCHWRPFEAWARQFRGSRRYESHSQHNLASRLTPLKRTMRIRGIGQGERRTDSEVEPAVFDAVEEHCRTLRQLLRAADEPCQRRTREEDPARGVQSLNVERRHLTGGSAEEHH